MGRGVHVKSGESGRVRLKKKRRVVDVQSNEDLIRGRVE